MVRLEKLDSAIYSEASPGEDSNFLYSGYYKNISPSNPSNPSDFIGLYLPTEYVSFSAFTPDSTPIQQKYGNQVTGIATSIDRTVPLTRKNDQKNSTDWAPGYALVSPIPGYAKTYLFKTGPNDTDYKCMNIWPSVTEAKYTNNTTSNSTTSFYLYENFTRTIKNNVVELNNELIPNESDKLPFDKYIAFSTTKYINTTGNTSFSNPDNSGKTIQSLIVTNKNTTNVTVDLKMYLGTTSFTTNSVKYNPYCVKIQVFNSDKTINYNSPYYCSKNPSDSSPIYNNSSVQVSVTDYIINNDNLTIPSGGFLSVSLLKFEDPIISSQRGVGASDSSVLFIDLDSLLYRQPGLQLVENPDIVYGDETKGEITCNITPTNINNDNLDGQKVSLTINDTINEPFSLESTVSNNKAKFSFPTDYQLNTTYTYSASVTYTPPLLNQAVFPDALSHYYSADSQPISFTVIQQKINIVYDATQLSTEKSILSMLDLSDWSVKDDYDSTDEGQRLLYLAGTFLLKIYNPSGSSIEIPGTSSGSSTTANFSDLNNIDISDLAIGTQYSFDITFTPSDSQINPATSIKYFFTTETPRLVLLSDQNIGTLGYTSESIVNVQLQDSASNIYSNAKVPGTVSFAVTNSNSPYEPITLPGGVSFEYNNTNKVYTTTISPKKLQLVKYDYTNYKVTPTFTFNNSLTPITTLQDENPTFEFKGVGINLERANNDVIYSFDGVPILATLLDINSGFPISSIDLPGIMTLKYGSTDIDSISTQNFNKNYLFSFVPNEKQMTPASGDIQLTAQFNLSGSSPLIDKKLITLPITIKKITPTIGVKVKDDTGADTNNLSFEYNELFSFDISIEEKTTDATKNGTLSLYKGAPSDGNSVNTSSYNLKSGSKLFTTSIAELISKNFISIADLKSSSSFDYRVKWDPTSVDIYESSETDSITINLKSTETSFTNVKITPVTTDFTNKITVSGEVSSGNTGETFSGDVDLILSDEFGILINGEDGSPIIKSTGTLTPLVGKNTFLLELSSDIPITYYFALRFRPTQITIYSPISNNHLSNYNISFIKKTIKPTLLINNVPAVPETSLKYTDTFAVKMSGLTELVNNTNTVKIRIFNGTNTLFESALPLTINSDGTVSVNDLNLVDININKIANLQNITVTIEVVNIASNQYYDISQPENNEITINTDTSNPQLNSIEIDGADADGSGIPLLNYNGSYNISGSFDTIKNTAGTILPITGKLQLYKNGTALFSQFEITINTTSPDKQIIFYGFNPSDYSLSAGTYVITFEFNPDDKNIRSLTLTEEITIIPDTITISDFKLQVDTIYYGETFTGSFVCNTNDAQGTIDVYVVNPSNYEDVRKINAPSVQINTNTETTYSFTCAQFPFDITDNTTVFDVILKFTSNVPTKVSNRDNISFPKSCTISKMPVKISELAIKINGVNYTLENLSNGILLTVGDSVIMDGKLKTLNDIIVSGGNISLISFNSTNASGMYINGITNPNLQLNENAIMLDNKFGFDSTTKNDYVKVDDNGKFSVNFTVYQNSIFYTNPGTMLQILYYNSMNYLDNYFWYDGIQGIYSVVAIDSTSDIQLKLDNSNLTNSLSFPYHEDSLHFVVETSVPYVNNASCTLTIASSTVNQSYSLIVVDVNGSCYAEMYLNPRLYGLVYNLNNYSASATFAFEGSASQSRSNTKIFYIQKTESTISLEFKNDNGLIISNIDYEGNVNIGVEVKTSYEIQEPFKTFPTLIKGEETPRPIVTRDINGTFVMKNSHLNGSLGNAMDLTNDAKTFNSYTFDSTKLSSQTTTFNYAPYLNAYDPISQIYQLYAEFTTNDSANYNPITTFLKAFTIGQYSPTLTINSIESLTDKDPDTNLAGSTNNYRNYINYDEDIKVTATLSKNILGSFKYYYSTVSDYNAFTQINPITGPTVSNGSHNEPATIEAIFDHKTLKVINTNNNSSYLLKVDFIPSSGNDYNIATNNKSFNVYEANNFADVSLSFDNNNNTSKTVSYDGTKSYNVTITASFNSDVSYEERYAKVDVYYDSYDTSNKIDIASVIISSENPTPIISISNTKLMYKSAPYVLKAIITPVIRNNSDVTNINYPLVKEVGSAALTVQPFITSTETNFTYQYSNSKSFSMLLHTGSDAYDPYDTLNVKITNQEGTNTDSYTHETSTPFDYIVIINNNNGTFTFNFANFEEYINSNGINLAPGSYILEINATQEDNEASYTTETFTTNFVIEKKDVILDVTFDSYNTTYRGESMLNINIGELPIDNGDVAITFTKVDNTNVTYTKTINSNDLLSTTTTTNQYQYNIDDNSSVIKMVGIYSLYAELNNKFYSGSVNSTNILTINKETECFIDFSSDRNFYTMRYGSEPINFAIDLLYKSDSLNTMLPNSNFTLFINGEDQQYDTGYFVQDFEFAIDSTSLQIGTNQLVLSYLDPNYSFPSQSFQIEVLKQIEFDPEPTLEIIEVDNENETFTAIIENYEYMNTDSIIFYETALKTQLDYTFNSTTNEYTVDYSNLSNGAHSVYVVVTGDKYEFDTNTRSIDKQLKPTTLTLKTSLDPSYYANTTIQLEYKVQSENHSAEPINDGYIEFHLIEDSVDSIIGYVKVVSNRATLAYTLLPREDQTEHLANFYAVFMKSDFYSSSTSNILAPPITILAQRTVNVINNSSVPDTLHLGDTVSLEFFVVEQHIGGSYTNQLMSTITDQNVAVLDYQTKSKAYTESDVALTIATDNLRLATDTFQIAQTEFTNAHARLGTAVTTLNNAEFYLKNATYTLNAAETDVQTSDTQLRIVQTASRHVISGLSLADAEEAKIAAETQFSSVDIEYNLSITPGYPYDLTKKAVSDQEVVVSTAATNLASAEATLKTATANLKTAQEAYIANGTTYAGYTEAHKQTIEDIVEKEAEIGDDLQTIIDTHLDVDTTLNLYNEKLESSFTREDINSIWVVIDQNSTNETGQNPFIILYTLPDTSTSNAENWYKSKAFYGSNEGANIPGPMLLYVGEDPTNVHPEIARRVQLLYNPDLSTGLLGMSEKVNLISLATSSNTSSTFDGDYDFVLREIGTGSTINEKANTLIFTPTALNNTQSIYADGSKGTDIQDVYGSGWGFSNILSNITMPKINWYFYNSLIGETYSDYQTALTAYNNAVTKKDTDETALRQLKLTETSAKTTASDYKTNSLDPAKNAYDSATSSYDDAFGDNITKKETYDSHVSLLNQYKLGHKPYLDHLSAVESDRTRFLIIVSAYEMYLDFLRSSSTTSISLSEQIQLAMNEASSTYAAKYAEWKTKAGQQKDALIARDLAKSARDSAETARDSADQAKTTALTAKMAADQAKTTALNAKNIAEYAKNQATGNTNLLTHYLVKDGYLRFVKKLMVNDQPQYEILEEQMLAGTEQPGIVRFSHRVTQDGAVEFYAQYRGSSIYADKVSESKNTTVLPKNNVTVSASYSNSGQFNELITGDEITLSFNVARNDNVYVTDGTVTIFQQINGNAEIIAIKTIDETNKGVIAFKHNVQGTNFTDRNNNIQYYAEYSNSLINNYQQSLPILEIVIKDNLNTTIYPVSSTNFGDYKIGTTVELVFDLPTAVRDGQSIQIRSGFVELYKRFNNIDDVIDSVRLDNIGNTINTVKFNTIVVNNGSVGYYARYLKNETYKSSHTLSSIINLTGFQQVPVTLENRTEPPPPESKLGDTLQLEYYVSSNSLPVKEGAFEIFKMIKKSGSNVFDLPQSLGYALVGDDGIAKMDYTITDSPGQMRITAKYRMSVNYVDENNITLTNDYTITQYYQSILTQVSEFETSYKIGDTVSLKYKVTDTDSSPIQEGNIYIYIIRGTSPVFTELLYVDSPDVNGSVSTEHIITDDNIAFFAAFKDSMNYESNEINFELINVSTESEEITVELRITEGSEDKKFGDSITLESTIVTFDALTDGIVTFYARLPNSEDEIDIGSSPVDSGKATISYTLSEVGDITFTSKFVNSVVYSDTPSDETIVSVEKRNINSIEITQIAPAYAVEHNFVTIEAKVEFGTALSISNEGTVTFFINNEEYDELVVQVDVIGGFARHSLQLKNTSIYDISAIFDGNETHYDSTTSADTTITPSPNPNYSSSSSFYTLSRIGNTEYVNNRATIGVSNSLSEVNKTIMKNTGFVLFIQKNDQGTETYRYVAPVVNGEATAILRSGSGYTVDVLFQDTLIDPTVTLEVLED